MKQTSIERVCVHHCIRTVLFVTPHRISPLFATRRAAVYTTAVSLRLALTIPFSLLFAKSQLASYVFPGHEIHNRKGEEKPALRIAELTALHFPFGVMGGPILMLILLHKYCTSTLFFFFFFPSVMDGAREGIAMRKRISTA